MTPQDKANKNILAVLQKIKNLQLQAADDNVQYRLGGMLISSEEEADILKMLEGKGLVHIVDAWGNNSSR